MNILNPTRGDNIVKGKKKKTTRGGSEIGSKYS
jgi:hypothetical protein